MAHPLYGTALWKRKRRQQLQAHPLCEVCEKEGRVVPATVVHHTTPHKGNRGIFFSSSLQSLCTTCHDGLMKSIERRGYDKTIGLDGWPVHNHLKNQ